MGTRCQIYEQGHKQTEKVHHRRTENWPSGNTTSASHWTHTQLMECVYS